MIQENSKHPKQAFQVDRIAFFSDAVFAIVITLLVIELKTPHINANTSKEEIFTELYGLKYNFLSIFLSFFVVAQQWFQHHFLFKYIHDYDKKILWASIIMLLPIIFFPFSTALFAETTQNKEILFVGLIVYAINTILAIGGIFYFYYITFVRSGNHTYEIPTPEKRKFLSENIFSFIYSSLILIFSIILQDFEKIMWPMLILALARKIILKFFIKK